MKGIKPNDAELGMQYHCDPRTVKKYYEAEKENAFERIKDLTGILLRSPVSRSSNVMTLSCLPNNVTSSVSNTEAIAVPTAPGPMMAIFISIILSIAKSQCISHAFIHNSIYSFFIYK